MTRYLLAKKTRLPLGSILLILSLTGCSSSDDDNDVGLSDPLQTLGPVQSTRHEGSDGLLAGLGLSGLREPPTFIADPTSPTRIELRRQAIHSNYVALVDQSENGGFGSLYGLMDDSTYPGEEHLAFIGEGINRATLMVQVPDSFDPAQACIVVAPSSGSRGVYGAVGTGGEWGLQQGCAVAYTDANKGTGAVELSQQKGFGIQLDVLDLTADTQEATLEATLEATFRVPTQEILPEPGASYADVPLPAEEVLDSWVTEHPDRYAFKHAHSQKNIEKDWGRHTVESVEFAFKVLNSNEASDTADGMPMLTRENTLVIGASVSNGGSALLRAVEMAKPDLFDGVVVGEPNVNPVPLPSPVSIDMTGRDSVSNGGQPAYEYFVTAELYAACATLDPANAGAQFAGLRGDPTLRCAALVQAGLLNDGTPEEQGTESSQRLIEGGYLQESLQLLVGYAGFDLFPALLTTYANAYTRSSVVDTLCDISMAHVATGETAPSASPALNTLASLSNGIPSTAGIQLIKENAPDGPTLLSAAPSSNGQLDYNFESAQCWQALLRDSENLLHDRLMQGISEVRASGNLQAVPTLIVHGRSDALIPVNHSSRPYYALNQQVEGESSKLRYYEITNSQHLDTLNPTYALAGMNFVPIDYYVKQALDLMLSHLRDGTALPASQVVKATAPEDGVLTPENVPDIDPASQNLIEYADGSLLIPD